jgi:hypothetical protein
MINNGETSRNEDSRKGGKELGDPEQYFKRKLDLILA